MYNVINLGGGVQSSTMALMACEGEINPMPDFCVFADTGAEPSSVYEYIDYLESILPFPIHRVSNGQLEPDSLTPRHRAKDSERGLAGELMMRRLIPLYGIMPDGRKTAAIGRKCTADYKIKPIMKFLREECGIRRGQEEVSILQWIGISWDEMQRMKESSVPWSSHRFPLIDLRMTRGHCLDWLCKNGYKTPPRSACYFCPFRSNDEWRNLRENDHAFYLKAIEFDNDIRSKYKDYDPTMQMEVFIHPSCKPLSDVDVDNDVDKGQIIFDFQSECDGMCGV